MHHKRKNKIGLLLLLLLFLTGCSASSGEKQIFPICLSMDRLADGRLQLAVQVSDMSGDKATEYTTFVAAGDSFGQTLEILGASMPYPLHFGQLRLCLLGYELASQEDLLGLLEPLYQLHTLNPQAAVMVCMGNAAKTMAAQQPDLGVRLSTYLDQLLARLRQEKLTPPETLWDVMTDLRSGYRDPLLGLCALNSSSGPDDAAQGSPSGNEESKPAFNPSGSIAIGEPSPGEDLPADLTAGSLPRKGGNPVEYIGCAAVGRGRVSGTFTALETRMLLTLRQEAQITDVSQTLAQIEIPKQKNFSFDKIIQLVTKWQLVGSDGFGVTGAMAQKARTDIEFSTFSNAFDPALVQLTITYK